MIGYAPAPNYTFTYWWNTTGIPFWGIEIVRGGVVYDEILGVSLTYHRAAVAVFNRVRALEEVYCG